MATVKWWVERSPAGSWRGWGCGAEVRGAGGSFPSAQDGGHAGPPGWGLAREGLGLPEAAQAKGSGPPPQRKGSAP